MQDDLDSQVMSRNPLAVFAPMPLGVGFESQEKGEKIVLLLRAHQITLLPVVLLTAVFTVLPIFLPIFGKVIHVSLANFLSTRQEVLVIVFWYLFVFGFAFYRFVLWYFNVYLVTNERIIDIDLRGLMSEEIAYARLGQIEDVSPRISGFFATFFDYGNVLIQTAAERNEFEFEMVAKPDDVARAIMEQIRGEEKEAPGEVA